MLARRSIQLLLNESGRYLTPGQRESLVSRLNNAREAIDAEWELIILSALASVGDVEHEPDLGGTARLDIRFRSSAFRFVGDVRAVSDEECHRENPIHQLSARLAQMSAVLQAEGIRGAFGFRVNGIGPAVWRGEYKTRLILPRVHEFRCIIFDARFNGFLAAIRREPKKVHYHVVDKNEVSVSIVFNPGGLGMQSYTHPPYNLPHDPIRNTVYGALEKKSRQIKHAGQRAPGALAGIILCDSGCESLRHSSAIGTSLDRIMATFLRTNHSVDFVCVVDVRAEAASWPSDRYLQFEARIWSMRDPSFDQALEGMFNQALQTLPAPVELPINVLNRLNRARESRQHPHAPYGRNGTMDTNSIEISLRAAMDYLAGRIDRTTFERAVCTDSLGILHRRLEDGRGISGVSMTRRLDKDDDGFVITFGGPDAAVGPFRATPSNEIREHTDDHDGK